MAHHESHGTMPLASIAGWECLTTVRAGPCTFPSSNRVDFRRYASSHRVPARFYGKCVLVAFLASRRTLSVRNPNLTMRGPEVFRREQFPQFGSSSHYFRIRSAFGRTAPGVRSLATDSSRQRNTPHDSCVDYGRTLPNTWAIGEVGTQADTPTLRMLPGVGSGGYIGGYGRYLTAGAVYSTAAELTASVLAGNTNGINGNLRQLRQPRATSLAAD